MTLEARLISNSNAFFARQDKSPLVADEYEKQFKIAFNDNKKSRYRLPSGTTRNKFKDFISTKESIPHGRI